MLSCLRKILLLAACLVVTSPCCFAEEGWQFVDAQGSTGYYVDMDTADYESAREIVADVAIIKADLNRKYIYSIRFNTSKLTYQILSSQSMSYDKQQVLDSDDNPRPAKLYSANSPMKEVVSYIQECFAHDNKLPPAETPAK